MDIRTRHRYCNMIALLADPTGMRLVVGLLSYRFYLVPSIQYTYQESLRRHGLKPVPIAYPENAIRRYYYIENLKCTVPTLYELHDLMQPFNDRYRKQIYGFLQNYHLHNSIFGVPIIVITACECRKNGHHNHNEDENIYPCRLYVGKRPRQTKMTTIRYN